MKQSNRIFALTGGLAGLTAFLLTSSLSQSARRGEDSYVRGLTLANQYECVRAIEEFDRAINANPGDPRFYTSRATCRMRELANSSANVQVEAESSEILAAVEDLTAAIKADPNHAEAYFERANAKGRLVHAGKLGPASVIEDYDRAIELEPENPEFLSERSAFLLAHAKDEKRGLDDLALLIKLEPKNSTHLLVRGLHFVKTDRLQLAIRDFSAALKFDPDNVLIRHYRANAYFETKQFAASLADANYLLKDPNVTSVSTLELRAKAYRAMGKKKLAEADERRAKKEREEFDREFEETRKKVEAMRGKVKATSGETPIR